MPFGFQLFETVGPPRRALDTRPSFLWLLAPSERIAD